MVGFLLFYQIVCNKHLGFIWIQILVILITFLIVMWSHNITGYLGF